MCIIKKTLRISPSVYVVLQNSQYWLHAKIDACWTFHMIERGQKQGSNNVVSVGRINTWPCRGLLLPTYMLIVLNIYLVTY